MMKSSELLIIVDSVEEAVKFYTEKLAFDIVDLQLSKESPGTLQTAHVRKGKCFVSFRTPLVEELAEFSFIKRCASRCVGLYVEMKKGVEKYFDRCQKKGLKVVSDLKGMPDGSKNFAIRDPFGIKLVFNQVPEKGQVRVAPDLLGMHVDRQKKESVLMGDMIDHLKKFGVLRRSAKKYSKLKLKQIAGKAK